MNENRVDQTELMANYTLLPSLSVGVHYAEYRREGETPRFFIPTLGFLVKRWNEYGLQANLYAEAGYGYESSSASGKGLGAIEADIESRRLYASTRAESLGIFEMGALGYCRLRTGFAPYLAPYEGIHAWVLFQLEYRTWTSEYTLTPMLRFFYQNVLFEIGQSLKGAWQFNWTVEF
jgi:hypothetical protein